MFGKGSPRIPPPVRLGEGSDRVVGRKRYEPRFDESDPNQRYSTDFDEDAAYLGGTFLISNWLFGDD